MSQTKMTSFIMRYLFASLCVIGLLYSYGLATSRKRCFGGHPLDLITGGKTCCGNERILEMSDVSRAIFCADHCTREDACESFFYSPESETCHGCNALFNESHSAMDNLTDSVYYSSPPECRKKTTTPFRYIGCYWDARVMVQAFISSRGMTLEICHRNCLEYNVSTFAVYLGDRCRCEVIPGDVAPSEKCDQPCYGDKSQMCGGSGKIKSAYLVLP